jgi:hypothetical protein
LENNLGSSNRDSVALLFSLLLIFGGTAFLVWMSTWTHVEIKAFTDLSISLMTFLAIQPGIFLTFKIGMNTKLSKMKRLTWGLIAFALLVVVIPFALANQLDTTMQGVAQYVELRAHSPVTH